MADPLADHENNTLTTLKLFERIKDFAALEKVVYASAGCTVAEKTFDEAEATSEDAPVSLWLDSPYQISKIIGEYYSNYYFARHGVPDGQGALPERLRARRGARRRRVARDAEHGLANVTPTFVYRALKRRGAAGRERRHREPRLHLRRRHRRTACSPAPRAASRAASTTSRAACETTIRELAELVNELTGNPTPIALTPARDWDHSGKRHGDPAKAQASSASKRGLPLRDGLERTIAWTRENLDWIEPCMVRHADQVPELRELVSSVGDALTLIPLSITSVWTTSRPASSHHPSNFLGGVTRS